MKKNIFLILLLGMTFSIAFITQSCGDKKTTPKDETALSNESNVVVVSNTIVAGDSTKTFKVHGNCARCKRKIEDSVTNIGGISTGQWNAATGEMTVTFNANLISLDSIKQRIANAGYDSDTHKAKDEVYNLLPATCKYERPTKVETGVAPSETVGDATKKVNFIVYGNCAMCERAIEYSVKNLDGITLADWNMETDEMTVVFNPEIISLNTIKQKIADRGYDSDTHRAKAETYKKLPGSCKYERPE